MSLDHGVDDDVPEVAGAGLARDARHLGLVLHDEASLDRQHVQNLIGGSFGCDFDNVQG